jgi:type I restriction enzyme R subunit
VSLSAIEAATTALARLTLVGQAANALVAPDERRKGFLAMAKLADRLYAAIKPHPAAIAFMVRMSTVAALAEKIRLETAPELADLTDVLRRIGEVLDRSIEGSPVVRDSGGAIDLSRIDFQALAARFKDSKSKSLDLERLKAAVRAQLDRLIEANETRVDLREKFESLIEAYNAGTLKIEKLFSELLVFAQTLSTEQARHVRENLSEEELVVFDLLTRPGPDLTSEERDEVKKVARQLLTKLREIVSLDWQRTANARARVREAVEEALDAGLPRAYTPELYRAKAGAVFQHVYERFGVAA